jgi:hypothetical protein
MKRITYFLIPLLLSTNTNALDSFIVDFKLIIDNLEVAKEVRVLDRYVDKYVYTANAKTTGIAKLLGDISIEAKSVFTINDSGVNSQKYIMNEKRDKAITKSYALNFSSENNTVISEPTINQTEARVFKTEKGNILDPLSLFMALSYDLEKNPNQLIFNYQIADGKYLKTKKYKKTSNQSLMINNKMETVITIEQLDSDEPMMALFSPKHQFLPVLIKQSKRNSEHRYVLTGLKVKMENSELLQVIF